MQFKFKSACQKKLIDLLTNLSIILIVSFLVAPTAVAITQELQFDTTAGYQIRTTFSYDEAKKFTTIEEKGHGDTKAIDSMKVRFYDPSGELIANYDNIVDGQVTGSYFEFNFDPIMQKLSGNIDIGGESAGEMYLKGEADRELSLIEVDELGEEKAIDFIRD